MLVVVVRLWRPLRRLKQNDLVLDGVWPPAMGLALRLEVKGPHQMAQLS